MDPNMATEIPATIMVLIPVPSHTMNKGARADLGRLFKTTRYGSSISEHLAEYHKRVADNIPIKRTSRKLATVSRRVIPVFVKNVPSFTISQKHKATRLGLLKKNASIYPI